LHGAILYLANRLLLAAIATDPAGLKKHQGKSKTGVEPTVAVAASVLE
jgi:hypothetical protein